MMSQTIVLLAWIAVQAFPLPLVVREVHWEGDEPPTFLVRRVEKALFEGVTISADATCVLETTITKTERDYVVEMSVTSDGSVLASGHEECSGCASTEVVRLVTGLRDRLLHQAATTIFTIAEKRRAAAEAERLRAQQEEMRRRLEARRLAEQKRRELLRPVILYEWKEPTKMARWPEWSHPSPPYRMWTYGAAGIGAAMLVTGITLLALDGTYPCDGPDPRHTCPEVYDTSTAGWSFVLGGLLFGAAAGWGYYTQFR